MAGVCTKCGASLPDDGPSFCTSCGAQIEGHQAVPPQPGVPLSAVPPVAAPYPPAAPPKRSGVLKGVLIGVGVVIMLVVVGVGVVAYMGYRAFHKAGNSFSLGSSAQVTDADLGAPVYPGATRIEGAGMRLKAANNLMVSASFTTHDPMSSVLDFYRSNVGGQAIESKNVRGTSFESATVNGSEKDSVVITIAPTPSDSSLTQIVILHTKSSTPSSTPAVPAS